VNIGILTSTNPQLRQQAAPDGPPPEAKTGSVGEQAAAIAAPKPRPTVNVAPSVKFPSLRAALDARIAADVSSGQLSPDDAVTVGQALDAIDSRSRRSTPANAARNYLATIDPGTLIDRFG